GQTRRGGKISAETREGPETAKRSRKMEHLTVRANGAAFHVDRICHGQPLLLLHGWPEFWLTWKPVMTRLADRFTLYAPDLRGFGGSDQPAGPSWPEDDDTHM